MASAIKLPPGTPWPGNAGPKPRNRGPIARRIANSRFNHVGRKVCTAAVIGGPAVIAVAQNWNG